jgi:hypothetical protein
MQIQRGSTGSNGRGGQITSGKQKEFALSFSIHRKQLPFIRKQLQPVAMIARLDRTDDDMRLGGSTLQRHLLSVYSPLQMTRSPR